MKMLIVPESVRKAIEAKITEAREAAGIPQSEWTDRDQSHAYRTLLEHFDEFGAIPNITLRKIPQ